jgi:hypothetical protein
LSDIKISAQYLITKITQWQHVLSDTIINGTQTTVIRQERLPPISEVFHKLNIEGIESVLGEMSELIDYSSCTDSVGKDLNERISKINSKSTIVSLNQISGLISEATWGIIRDEPESSIIQLLAAQAYHNTVIEMQMRIRRNPVKMENSK